jgi:hypothetical protein
MLGFSAPCRSRIIAKPLCLANSSLCPRFQLAWHTTHKQARQAHNQHRLSETRERV